MTMPNITVGNLLFIVQRTKARTDEDWSIFSTPKIWREMNKLLIIWVINFLPHFVSVNRMGIGWNNGFPPTGRQAII